MGTGRPLRPESISDSVDCFFNYYTQKLLLVKDADKLTLGQELPVTTHYTIERISRTSPPPLMDEQCLYESLSEPAAKPLTNTFSTQGLPAPGSRPRGPIARLCGDREPSTWAEEGPDRPTIPWCRGHLVYARQQSCAQQSYTGAAVVSDSETTWALIGSPAGISAQHAEHIALTEALELEKAKKL